MTGGQHHHASHNGPLLLRPLPLPGELPRVQSRNCGQEPLGDIVPGAPFDSFGFVSEKSLEYAAPENYIRWVQPIESELDKQASLSNTTVCLLIVLVLMDGGIAGRI